MFEFIRLQYRMGNIGTTQVEQFAVKGWVTADEAERIIHEDVLLSV